MMSLVRSLLCNLLFVENLDNNKICNFFQLACCRATSLVLTSEGHIYGCGNNIVGQLATGNTADQLSMTRIATELGCVGRIAAVNKCEMVAALTKTNYVYIWGFTVRQVFLKPDKTLLSIDDAEVFLKPHLIDDTSTNNIDDVFSHYASPPISFRPLSNGNNFAIIFYFPICSLIT